MKTIRVALAAAACAVLAACSGMSLDPNTLVQSGTQAVQAASLTDTDVRTLSDKSCAQLDAENKIAPASSPYTKRLNKIAAQLGDNINGVPVNYKVYLTKDVNAWAMANGCVAGTALSSPAAASVHGDAMMQPQTNSQPKRRMSPAASPTKTASVTWSTIH